MSMPTYRPVKLDPSGSSIHPALWDDPAPLPRWLLGVTAEGADPRYPLQCLECSDPLPGIGDHCTLFWSPCRAGSTIVTVCAWCGGSALDALAELLPPHSLSHGICGSCADDQEARVLEMGRLIDFMRSRGLT